MAFGKSRRSAQTYDNTNRGILFENDRKRSDKHPDFRGNLNVEGREYWVSGWEKETKNGPALSLSIEPKQEVRRQQYERSRGTQNGTVAHERGARREEYDRGAQTRDDWNRGSDEPPFNDEVPFAPDRS